MSEPLPSAEGAILADKYEVGRMIGRGGLAAVHEGRHVELGRVVAIKLIDPALLENAEVIARFRQEARATSAVQSDHIVQVFDVGEDPRVGLFMVMEQLVGEDLEGTLAKKHALPVKLSVDIAQQVARGLARAHAVGIVHRDLKPANVFLTTRDDGTTLAKILDFGISKLLRSNRTTTLAPMEPSMHSEIAPPTNAPGITRYGTALGTPQYMSPEQAQGKAVDRRTDVWALGAVLFEMIAGVPAFEEKPKFEDTVDSIVNRPAPYLKDVAPQVPKAIADVVAQALERDLDRRIQDCESFARMLGEAMQAREQAPTLDDAPAIIVEPDPKSPTENASQIVDITDLAPERDGTLEPSWHEQTSRKQAPKRSGSAVRSVALALLALILVAGAGAWMARDGKSAVETTSAAPSESTSASLSASTHPSATTKPKPWKPLKPKTKPSASASASVSTGKGFGAAGVATTY